MLRIVQDNNEIVEITNDLITFKFYKIREKSGSFDITYRDINGLELGIRDCYSSINFYESDFTQISELNSLEFAFDCVIEEIEDSPNNLVQVGKSDSRVLIDKGLLKVSLKATT